MKGLRIGTDHPRRFIHSAAGRFYVCVAADGVPWADIVAECDTREMANAALCTAPQTVEPPKWLCDHCGCPMQREHRDYQGKLECVPCAVL